MNCSTEMLGAMGVGRSVVSATAHCIEASTHPIHQDGTLMHQHAKRRTQQRQHCSLTEVLRPWSVLVLTLSLSCSPPPSLISLPVSSPPPTPDSSGGGDKVGLRGVESRVAAEGKHGPEAYGPRESCTMRVRQSGGSRLPVGFFWIVAVRRLFWHEQSDLSTASSQEPVCSPLLRCSERYTSCTSCTSYPSPALSASLGGCFFLSSFFFLSVFWIWLGVQLIDSWPECRHHPCRPVPVRFWVSGPTRASNLQQLRDTCTSAHEEQSCMPAVEMETRLTL